MIDYDPNGNTSLGRAAQTYAYDKDDRLLQLTAGGTTVSFKYDYSGRRVAKVVGTAVTRYYNDLLEGTSGELTKYYFLGGLRVAAQRVSSSTYAWADDAPVQIAAAGAGRPVLVLLLRRDAQIGVALSVALLGTGLLLAPWRRKRVVGVAVRHGHVIGVVIVFGLSALPWPLMLRPLGPAAAEAQSVPWLVHFHVDHLGSTQVVTKSDGTVFEEIRYKAYGEVRGHYTDAGGWLNDCADDRYCQEFTQYDTEPISQLEYAGARYYDPYVGVFLTHDPAREFASPYTYTNWDPVNETDSTGACLDLGISCLALALLVVAATAVATAIDTGIRTGDVGAAFAAGAIAGAIGLAGVGLGVVVAPAFQALPPIAQYAVALGAGGYGTYQAVDNGYYATAIVGAFATVLAAYGISKGPNGEEVAQGGSGSAGNSSPTGAQDDSGDLVPAADTSRVPRHTENLGGLDPRFRGKVEAVMVELEDRGYDPHVPAGSGLRSSAQQLAKFHAGFSKIASGGPHEFGMAADIVDTRWGWGEFPASPWLGKPAYENYWANLRVAAYDQGLAWGGNFGRLGPYNLGWDPAHVEMSNWRVLVTH